MNPSRHPSRTTSPARHSLGQLTLPAGVRLEGAWHDLCDRVRSTWDERADETGVDEAATKMIWLAVGITVAVAATGFFLSVFNSAKAAVPDPVAP
jgi:hypothetical protein